jgi:uncharacterized CHY-type Zn-finger protein
MRDVAFTTVYGSKKAQRKYRRMAKLLEIGVRTFSPQTEFRVFTGSDFEDRPIVKIKDRFRGKLEICRKCNDPDTRYMYMDADTFVFCDLEPMLNLNEEGTIALLWKKSPGGKWAGREDLDFRLGCKRAGIEGDIQAYQLNAGFMMWHGGIDVFDRALHLFDNYDIPDWKGTHDDEYYICAAIQHSDVKVRNVEDLEANEMRPYWLGTVSVKDCMLYSDAFTTQGRIQHYGMQNWKSKPVQTVARSILRNYYQPANFWDRMKVAMNIY